MANCHHLFGKFHDEISIPKTKMDRMSDSKEGLRKRIREYFRQNHPEYVPKFFIQGSSSPRVKTGIRTKDDICDLDDGVYFLREPDETSTTLQTWVKDAVKGYTETDPEHRKKCIRDIFVRDYEIDHPVYYKIDGRHYQLAVKDTGWEDSDPRAFIDWFVRQKDPDGQLIRIVKFEKAWCDEIRNKMPNDFAMTILACNAKNRIYYNERDDITLRDTLREIKKALDLKFQCIVPAVPYDDLFAGYSTERKNNFMNALNNFLDDADAAIREDNELKASRLWRKHLGTRFPEGEDKNTNQSRNSSLIIGAGSANPWS